MVRSQAPRGTEDLLPERISLYRHIFGTCRDDFARHAYRELRTPLFEETSLFVRSLGEVTDVVEKEMFTVTRGDTSVTFRPEGTASAVRAYLEHHLDKVRPFQKFFYMGPMFRFERPQAGRQRQFDQIGIEALGSSSPLLDAEVILLAHRCFSELGLKNFAIHVNSIGDRDDRTRFREVLRSYMADHLNDRCDNCKKRIERNVFRMLDCKENRCRATNAEAPRFLDHLSDASRDRFNTTISALEKLEIPHIIDHAIVRGFDYYTHTVFEVRCPDLGARDAICGGGRYDNLIADMGGPELGSTGFAIGVTPMILALELQKHPCTETVDSGSPIFVAAVTDAEREAAFLLTDRLRQANLTVDTDFEGKSLKAQFKAAGKRGVELMLVLGPDEIAAGVVKVKDFKTSEESSLATDENLANALRARLQSD